MKPEEIHAIMAKLKIGSLVSYKRYNFDDTEIRHWGRITDIKECHYKNTDKHEKLCWNCIGYIQIIGDKDVNLTCVCGYDMHSNEYDFLITNVLEDFISKEEFEI